MLFIFIRFCPFLCILFLVVPHKKGNCVNAVPFFVFIQQTMMCSITFKDTKNGRHSMTYTCVRQGMMPCTISSVG